MFDRFRFLDDRRGSFPMMMSILLLPMVAIAGGALDLVAHERARVVLQDTLDRGVLAAAALEQTQDPRALVVSYLKNIPGIDAADIKVKDNKSAILRKVQATAKMPYKTIFMQIVGIDEMTVSATSTAQEARQNVEMSLVLDISGSMLDNGGMAQLIPAAKSFLDIILNTDSARKATSVNLVPFAGGVNLGAGPFDYLAGGAYARRHSKSSCFELINTDFTSSSVPVWSARDQFPHFTYYNYNVAGKQPWWCPTDSAGVSYMTNDLTALKAKVSALQPFDGTGTAYGMKWATLLLDPAMKNTLKGMATAGVVTIPDDFKNRPAAFSDKSTLKFIVLMSDGQIGFQPRPKSPATNEVTTKNISAASDNRVLFTETESSNYYKQVCTNAKANGITIFTIAFKVSATVAANIATCATDASYAYKVDGLDMASAFQSIATTIKKIRITE
jgi:Flp pilus assembly protein TadG